MDIKIFDQVTLTLMFDILFKKKLTLAIASLAEEVGLS